MENYSSLLLFSGIISLWWRGVQTPDIVINKDASPGQILIDQMILLSRSNVLSDIEMAGLPILQRFSIIFNSIDLNGQSNLFSVRQNWVIKNQQH